MPLADQNDALLELQDGNQAESVGLQPHATSSLPSLSPSDVVVTPDANTELL
jgi:hypothetical protein